jgi:hypothetical protein
MKAPLNAYRFQEPITQISALNLGKPLTFTLPTGKTICYIIATLAVTASATGAATKTIPRPSWGAGECRFKLGNVNRTRTAAQLFGIRGLNALNSVYTAGTVQYAQGGNTVTVAYNGFTIGNEPVLIDSPEDAALQAALANNTATTATFTLPFVFAEDWRNNPVWAGEGMALPTGFDDGTVLGTPYLEIDIPAATGVAGTMTAVAASGSLVYTENTVKAGSVVKFSKEKIHQKVYAVGQIELGDQFATKDVLQRFSLLTASDKITSVIVKKGSRIIRQVTFAENHNACFVSQINGRAFIANRFDVELDLNDDPTTALALGDLTQPLSVLATFATANDNPLNCLILASYYGPVE